MPFLLYRKERNESGECVRLVLHRGISLAGKSGPFRSHVAQLLEKKHDDDIVWKMDEADIISKLGEENPQDYSIIIDMKPSVKGNVSLYQIKRIWGYTCPEWTPLALQLKPLYVDLDVQDPEGYKLSFDYPMGDIKLVHEFLYLQGGYEGGNWVWGRVGSVNGTLLWPEVFNYFVECIKPYTNLPSQNHC